MKKEFNRYLECAKAVGTHGVKGAVRLENRCDTPQTLASLDRMYQLKNGAYLPLKVLHSSVQKNMVLTTFEGVDTLEAAIALRDTVLYAERNQFRLEKESYFIADLIGLPVIEAATGDSLGKVADVLRPGAQQIYVVDKPESGQFMIPAVKEFILDVSFGEDKPEGVYVKLIEGMID